MFRRGPRVDAPILLKVHGGPGQAAMPTIHMNARLEEHFLVVEWDQRGAGKSAAAAEPRAEMTLDQIVADTIELTERLVDEYGPRQVILLGHSWGSLVGVMAVHRRPDLYAAFVSTGQIATFADGQRIAYGFVVAEARCRGHAEATTATASMPPPPYDGAEGYFNALTAPHKQWVWFEESAHFPQWEEADAFNQLLIETVLPTVSA
jgi:pimeloyl-ACP methyl ester carboxylesterase